MRQYSAAARNRLTEPWEEFVPHVYDDKRQKERVGGRLQYPEWDGGEVRGTLTIGFGHTDAAGGFKIVQGSRISRDQAGDILSADLAPVVSAVHRLLRVEVTQHQFDALVDTHFNCPAAAIAAIRLINAGRVQDVPAKLLQYTFSKGEHMDGLTHRRTAEIAWFHTPDHVDAPPTPDPEIVSSFLVVCFLLPKHVGESKTAAAATSIFSLSLAEMAKAFNDLLEPIKEAKGSLADLGLLDGLAAAIHNPVFLASVAVAGLCVFIVWDRRNKLVNDHV